MNYKNIIFDLDGTLTNPYEGIFNALRYSLTRMGYKNLPERVPSEFVGPPLQKSFSEIYGYNNKEVELAIKIYREYYGVKGLFENEPYQGIIELLESLASSSYEVFVATSKLEESAWAIMKHFEMDKYIRDLNGSDYSGHLSKAQLITSLMEKYSLRTDETVMVGDTLYDHTGARANQIDFIAVGYGFGNNEVLKEHQPTRFADTVEELSEILL